MAPDDDSREMCWVCHRPTTACICRLFDDRPRIDNRTEIIILQHPRERFHPVGTARIARIGLARVRYEAACGQGWRGLTRELALPANSGLLYPHPAARKLDQVPSSEHPHALVLLDGTWANARKLYKQNAWLASAPHFELSPSAESQYRIRGQPQLHCLSTIEAIVEALKIIEPETKGFDELLDVFREMIDAQVEARDQHGTPRTRRVRQRQRREIPRALVDASDRLVVAYAESAPGTGSVRRLVRWTALRPATGECFDQLVRCPADPTHLAHMGLSPADFEGANANTLVSSWSAFVGQRAVLAAWNQSVLDLHAAHLGVDVEPVLLKAAYCNLRRAACRALDQVVAKEGLQVAPAPIRGRAGLRLRQTEALVHLLQAAAVDAAGEPGGE